VEWKYPPCREACPAGVNVQAYVALIAQGKYKEALEIIRRSIPFPSVCGRVCFSPCEDACTRKDIDEPVRIRSLKRLAADYEASLGAREKRKSVPQTHSEKVAIIGAGPAGLTAAFDLARLGYPVTVFERSSKIGGSLRYCIPEYRLPEKVLDSEIAYIKGVGVDIRTETSIGEDVTVVDLQKQGFRAIFIATGAHHGLELDLKGMELKGVFNALHLLEEVRVGKQVELGAKVAVIGGGNVAIDTARTAKRLGPEEVTVIYRRSEKEMPAHQTEVDEAKVEGVRFHFLATPRKIHGENGRVTALECVKNILGVPDESGRSRPVPIEGSEFAIPVDSVLFAVGEMPEVSFLPDGITLAKGNRVVVDELTLQTNLPGVFAGGDIVSGPASVIDAIAAGKRAAVSIDRYVRGVDLRAGRKKAMSRVTWVSDESSLMKKPRQPVQYLTPTERISCFKEVDLGLTPDAGLREARRCLFCGPCSECLEPEELCVADDIAVDEDKCIACANCEHACEFGAIRVEKSGAKVNPMMCKGCGTCTVECPAEAISLKEFSDDAILSQIRKVASFQTRGTPQALAFVCSWSSDSDVKDLRLPKTMHVISVRCAGRVDPLHILEAFKLGIDRVIVVSCSSKDCHYVFGSTVAEKRIKQVKEWLHAVGIDPRRLERKDSTAGDPEALNHLLKNFAQTLHTTLA
jgi:NADPH-dependent glutamate synthase beta subunit-like oxidoreductase/coenzyme F420-reducing hydrogenase delta subunit